MKPYVEMVNMGDLQDQKEWIYHKFQPRDIPENFPNRKVFYMLRDIFHGRAGPLRRFVSCGGVRYVLILEFNEDVSDCLENSLLEKIYESCAVEDMQMFREKAETALESCMTAFWPYLLKDYVARRRDDKLMKPVRALDFDRDDYHSVQLISTQSTVTAICGEVRDDQNFKPIANTFKDIETFPKTAVSILEIITMNVFRVRIHDQDYCLKAGRPDLIHSVEKLQMTSHVANVLKLSGVVVNGNEKIVGFLTPFVSGILLSNISSATQSQKEKWRAQISRAVICLHEIGIVWGDVKPDNVIVTKDTNEPVLIDFDGGTTDGWVDEELQGTKEGDLQGLTRIQDFIDGLHIC